MSRAWRQGPEGGERTGRARLRRSAARWALGLGTGLALAAAACAGPRPVEPAPAPGADVRLAGGEAPTADGQTSVRWRPAGEPLAANRMLELELELRSDGQPLRGAQVHVSAFMPDHGHGMNYVPVTTEVGAGRYRTEGFLLHMPGYWELHVDVLRDGVASRATFPLEL
jgi:hypothetical protein